MSAQIVLSLLQRIVSLDTSITDLNEEGITATTIGFAFPSVDEEEDDSARAEFGDDGEDEFTEFSVSIPDEVRANFRDALRTALVRERGKLEAELLGLGYPQALLPSSVEA